MRVLRRHLVVAPFALASRPAWSEDRTPFELTLARQGALPIILTAPHGGREAPPGIAQRSPSNSKSPAYARWGGFAVDADARTDLLAERITEEIRRQTGQAPYLVVARFARRYVDVNRPPD